METNEKKGHKIYAMLLEIGDTFFLTVQYASSLEEAFNQAKLEFSRLNPSDIETKNALLSSKIGLFGIKSINEMLHENKVYNEKKLERIAMKHHKAEQRELKAPKQKVEIKKVELSKEEIKNMIMKEIVIRKDKVMFESHKELFNDYERQYLADKIKGKTK
jgi:hypothetical protein